MKKVNVCVLFFTIFILSCSIFRKDVKKNQSYLYKVSGMPVRATDYKAGKRYVVDYEILKTYSLSDSDTAKLNAILATDSLILKVNHRSCEFFPAYAVKWASGRIALISVAPCPKIQVIKKAGDNDTVNDLKDHSLLETWALKKDTIK
jgi:hypothetical protein